MSSLVGLMITLLLHSRRTVSEKSISVVIIVSIRWVSESVALYKLKIVVIVVSRMMR